MRALSERSDALPALAEAFRRGGFAGTSIASLSQATGLGKGSLYNFFPGGKDEMAAAVLDSVRVWFDVHVFDGLREAEEPAAAIAAMFIAVRSYFTSRQLVCLFGAFALGQEHETFAAPIVRYFETWILVLSSAIERCGVPAVASRLLATDVVTDIQGALVLARATGGAESFDARLDRLERRLSVDIAEGRAA
jgi:TetR/AcrR family transcriptional repressor of lmrAB and yxaGH operons